MEITLNGCERIRVETEIEKHLRGRGYFIRKGRANAPIKGRIRYREYEDGRGIKIDYKLHEDGRVDVRVLDKKGLIVSASTAMVEGSTVGGLVSTSRGLVDEILERVPQSL